MGLFDDVRCDYPLPWPEAQGGSFQSYDTDQQYLEKYEIRANGELWYRKCTRQMEVDKAAPLGFWMVEKSAEWVRENPTGEIGINAWRSVDGINYEYSVRFWFRDGIVRDAVFTKSKGDNQASIVEPWPQLTDSPK